ncbi:MAG: hypothetical protein NTY30_03905 [Candidatus Berkelbacteria bacterium]|nr:hypothetical protein [Candidatus Berkelbacteria bacterium]
MPNKSNRIKQSNDTDSSTTEGAELEETHDISYHLTRHNSNAVITKEFHMLREKIQNLPGVEEIVNFKTGITYRTTKSFARFEFGRTFMNVLVREPKYNDPTHLVRDITSHMWGYKGKIKVTSSENTDAVFDIIKQSYEETL